MSKSQAENTQTTANAARMATRSETIDRHSKMKINIVKLKIDKSHLSRAKKSVLLSYFYQAKWCYNHFLNELQDGKDIKDIDKQPSIVKVKCGDDWEERDVDRLGSLMKSGVMKRVMSQLQGLSTKKKQGEKVGQLQFKGRMDSVPLRKYGEGYRFKFFEKKNGKKVDVKNPYNYITFTNAKKWFRIRGGDQILTLFEKYGEDVCEFADALLIGDSCGDFFVYVTIYTPYPEHTMTGQVCALDFGSSDKAHITTTDGEIASWKFLESGRLKEAQRANQTYRDWSEKKTGRAKSSNAQRLIIGKEYSKIDNKKEDVAAKFVHDLFEAYDYVVLQDEQLSGWAADERWSESVHHSVMGRILSRLKKHPRAIVIDKWAPTTKVCSSCGHILPDSLGLDAREWDCPECGSHHHRDVNAGEVMLLEADFALDAMYGEGNNVQPSGDALRVSRSEALVALATRVGDRSVI